MSKLDTILITTDWDNLYHDGETVLPEYKEQIKALMLELIGKDEVPGNGFGGGIHVYAVGRNSLRDDLRQEIEAL